MSLPTNRLVYFTVKNPIIAKRLVDQLVTTPNDSIILPFIDHPGPISQEILSRRFKSLTVCERDKDLRETFQSHVEKCYSDRYINIYPDDLFDLSFKEYCDEAQRRCSSIVKKTLDWDDDTSSSSSRRLKFLVPLMKCRSETAFLRNMYYQAALRLGLCSDTLINYYFLVSNRQFNYLNAKPSDSFVHYRSSTILYNTIFDICKLDTYNLKSSFEIRLRHIQNTSRKTDSAYQSVHLVSMNPRIDVIDNLGPKALLEFRFFINQIMGKRTGLVLSFLDRWFGDCSQDLLPLGISENTRAGDLDKEQYLELFKYLRQRDGYRRSTFKIAASGAEDDFAEVVPQIKV